MKIGMQVVIEDYVHNEQLKLAAIMANNFSRSRWRWPRSTPSSNCHPECNDGRRRQRLANGKGGRPPMASLSDRRSHLRCRGRRRRRRGPSGGCRCGEAGLRTACITKVFPTRSHTVAAQGGISASLGNMHPDDWRWHMYDTVKVRTGSAIRTRSNTWCATHPSVYELEHWGVPFSRTEDGKIYQRPFGGMTLDYGKVRRSAPAPPPTAPVTPCCTRCTAGAAPFGRIPTSNFFAIDLIMDDQGTCRGVIALKLDDGTLHRSRQTVILATGGYGAPTLPAPRRILHRRRGGMTLRAGLPLQDMEFVQFHPTGIYGLGLPRH